MSLKSKTRSLGRIIREKTGVKLPIAMRVAHLIVRDRAWDIPSELLTAIPFWCGWDCCGNEYYALVGPKGEYRVR